MTIADAQKATELIQELFDVIENQQRVISDLLKLTADFQDVLTYQIKRDRDDVGS